MNELTHISLFTGIGGIDLAAEWAGFKTILMVENNPYCQKVLRKHWPEVPILEDIYNVTKEAIQEAISLTREEAVELFYQRVLAASPGTFSQEAVANAIGNGKVGDKPKNGKGRGIEQDSERYCPHCDDWYPESSWKWAEDGRCPDCGEAISNAQNREQSELTEGYNPSDTQERYELGASARGRSGNTSEGIKDDRGTTKAISPTDGVKPVTLITGGFPCQPVSHAGKRKGKDDDRWLWPEMLRVISEVRPTWVVAENVAGLLNMGFNDCVSDLESEGYETIPFLIPACGVNAPHRRDRIFIVGYSNERSRYKRMPQPGERQVERASQDVADTGKSGIGPRREFPERTGDEGGGETEVGREALRTGEETPHSSDTQESGESMADTKTAIRRRSEGQHSRGSRKEVGGCGIGRLGSEYWSVEPELGVLANGISPRLGGYNPRHYDREPDIPRISTGVKNRVEQLKAYGNAVDPMQIYPILKAIAEIERSAKQRRK